MTEQIGRWFDGCNNPIGSRLEPPPHSARPKRYDPRRGLTISTPRFDNLKPDPQKQRTSTAHRNIKHKKVGKMAEEKAEHNDGVLVVHNLDNYGVSGKFSAAASSGIVDATLWGGISANCGEVEKPLRLGS